MLVALLSDEEYFFKELLKDNQILDDLKVNAKISTNVVFQAVKLIMDDTTSETDRTKLESRLPIILDETSKDYRDAIYEERHIC